MKDISGTLNLNRECCFAVALINYFRLNRTEIDEAKLFEKHLSSPYIHPDEGVDLLLEPKQIEYLTDGQYTAILYHLFPHWEEKFIKNTALKQLNGQEDKVKAVLEKMIAQGKIQYSKEDVIRLSQPLDTSGTILNTHSLNSTGRPYDGHAIVILSQKIYPIETYIEVDGNVYQMEDNDELRVTGCLEIKRFI